MARSAFDVRMDNRERLCRATDELARLSGALDAAIRFPGCLLSLEEIRERLDAARIAIAAAIEGIE